MPLRSAFVNALNLLKFFRALELSVIEQPMAGAASAPMRLRTACQKLVRYCREMGVDVKATGPPIGSPADRSVPNRGRLT